VLTIDGGWEVENTWVQATTASPAEHLKPRPTTVQYAFDKVVAAQRVEDGGNSGGGGDRGGGGGGGGGGADDDSVAQGGSTDVGVGQIQWVLGSWSCPVSRTSASASASGGGGGGGCGVADGEDAASGQIFAEYADVEMTLEEGGIVDGSVLNTVPAPTSSAAAGSSAEEDGATKLAVGVSGLRCVGVSFVWIGW
jgi:hypothetical protein